ncbi:MAG: YbaK/EbsC family protein, partial [Bacteroidales bacterium]|nr:YbaK/EbsC family protein [Bacteroidales bacterium]
YLGVKPGSVTPFGLMNDTEKHVHVFIDNALQKAEKLSFHPCINTASLIITKEDFIRFLHLSGNTSEWIQLY